MITQLGIVGVWDISTFRSERSDVFKNLKHRLPLSDYGSERLYLQRLFRTLGGGSETNSPLSHFQTITGMSAAT